MIRKSVVLISTIALLCFAMVGLAAAEGELPTWETVLTPEYEFVNVLALEEFKGDLYAAVSNELGVQVWKSPDGLNWAPVSDHFMDENGSPWFTSWDMAVFQDQLYLAVLWGDSLSAIFRTPDGINWEKVVAGDLPGPNSWEIWKLGIFKGMLYISAVGYTETDNAYNQIWRTPSGDVGSWELVEEIPNMPYFASFVTYKGALYGISDWSNNEYWETIPTQVWRTFNGVDWEPVVMDGFGNPNNINGGDFEVFGKYLYAAIGSEPESSGGEVYRTLDGLVWEQVVTGGAGNLNNYKFDGLISYLGDLYAYSVNSVDGCQVFRSKDGLNWTQVNESGWGNPLDISSHLGAAQAVFHDDLYMGTYSDWWQSRVVRLVHPGE